jgi:hypothetical protein
MVAAQYGGRLAHTLQTTGRWPGPEDHSSNRATGYCGDLRGSTPLGRGDASDKVFLFGFALSANRKGVQQLQGQGVLDGFVLTIA